MSDFYLLIFRSKVSTVYKTGVYLTSSVYLNPTLCNGISLINSCTDLTGSRTTMYGILYTSSIYRFCSSTLYKTFSTAFLILFLFVSKFQLTRDEVGGIFFFFFGILTFSNNVFLNYPWLYFNSKFYVKSTNK